MPTTPIIREDEVRTQKLILPDQAEEVSDFLHTDFLYNEPLNAAMQITADECRELDGAAVLASNSDVSFAARTPEGAIAGVRLACVIRRQGQVDIYAAKQAQSNGNCTSKVGEIRRILEAMESKIWEVVPADVNCLLYILIISVGSSFTRRGIAQKLVNEGLHEAKLLGCQGVITEATAIGSQTLFSKLGYEPLYEIRHEDWKSPSGERVFTCPDGTDKCVLYYKAL
ncbi:acetyltransferase [Aphelenchoides avenae]|nr:acetyltransferase [Aphelenchus avenae]